MEFENEIVKIREARKDAEARHASLRADADKVKAEIMESGADLATDKDAFTKVDEAYLASDAVRDEISDLRTREARLMEIVGEKVADLKDSPERREARNIGERFLASAEYKNLRASGRLESAAPVGSTAPVEVTTRDETVDGLRLRTTVDNSSGSGGGVIWSDRREDLIVPVPVRQIRLLDLVTVSTTDTDTIEWVKETTMTDAAAETAYGTAAPEAAYGYTKQSTTVKRIPHFVPATKGSLMDGGRLQSLLENRLLRGVRLRLEAQVLSGDGTGENLTGILSTSGIGSQALGALSHFDAVHKAITNVRINYLADDPNAIGLHPTDYEKVILEKDANGNYVHGRAASEGSVQTIWGLVPVVSTLFSVGTPLVGYYPEAELAVRTGVSVSASDSHSDFFTKGLVALLAELRAGFFLPQPKAFCKITGF